MGCFNSRDIRVEGVDTCNNSILYKRFKEAETSHETITMVSDLSNDGSRSFVISEIKTAEFGSNTLTWGLVDDNLLIAVNYTEAMLAVRDDYGNAYFVNQTGRFLSKSIIVYCLRLEYYIDSMLSDFRNIHNSKIYNACKCALINNMEFDNLRLIRINNSLQVRYGFDVLDPIAFLTDNNDRGITLMNKEEIVTCYIEGKVSVVVREIDTYKLNIVRFILNKVSRHEYKDSRVYEGMNLSSIKRVTSA